jgi:very-short-patch-repair endonuclease/predicted transcriptional regulator of viral defense system
MRHQTASHRIEELADRQYGVVSRRQLLEIGVTSSMIRGRLGNRALVELHRGVYAAGHRRLRTEGHWLAAVLAVGPGAALSHRDAAALHGLRPSDRTRIDVTARRRGRTKHPGIDIHHTAVLPDGDVTTIAAIPVTTVARTLVDLAHVVPRQQLARVLREAEHLRTVDVHELKDAMRRTRTRKGRGHAALKAVLEEHRRQGAQLTRSILEDRFLTLLDAHGLPRPRTNVHVAGMEVDACWRAWRLVVELDGWARHKDRQAFQRDRAKSNALAEAGFTVLRFTHDDVQRRPAETARRIRALLERA